jgi:hypothetical protein
MYENEYDNIFTNEGEAHIYILTQGCPFTKRRDLSLTGVSLHYILIIVIISLYLYFIYLCLLHCLPLLKCFVLKKHIYEKALRFFLGL